MASMSLSTPKHAREGHELAVRIDLSEPDTAGATKYVIAVESEAELAQLRQLLNEELIIQWMWADAGEQVQEPRSADKEEQSLSHRGHRTWDAPPNDLCHHTAPSPRSCC